MFLVTSSFISAWKTIDHKKIAHNLLSFVEKDITKLPDVSCITGWILNINTKHVLGWLSESEKGSISKLIVLHWRL